jgi:D-alanyl-D-alanine carboxypeptidase
MFSFRRVVIASLFVALSFMDLQAQTLDVPTRQHVEDIIQRCLREDGAPSASVAIVTKDRVAYANAFGNASLVPSIPATRATRYQLASLSKTFTAQAVLLMVSEGKLSLDDPISRWYPEVTEASHLTLRQLLSHTAGLPDHYPQTYPAGPRTTATTPDRIIAEWGRHPLLFPPGTQFHYSNLDYEIVGRIVEKVSGQTLFAYLQQHIFQPLDMSSAVDLDKLSSGSRALATGYVQNALAPLEPAPYEGPGWSFGAGQVVATAEDVARWDAAFLQHRVLPPAQAVEEVTQVHLLNGATAPTGLGLFSGEDDGVTRYYHTGQGLGFTAVNFIYPEAHMAFVVLANTNATGTAMKIADQLTYLLLPLSEKSVSARKVFIGLQSGRPDTALFSPDLKAYMTEELLASYRFSLAPLGPIQSFVAGRDQTIDGLENRDYDVVAGGHPLKLHLLLLPNGLLEDASITDAQSK